MLEPLNKILLKQIQPIQPEKGKFKNAEIQKYKVEKEKWKVDK